MPNYKRLTPFKRFVLQNFPFIESDFDALTNYGLMCKIVEYLNKVIASQNEVQANVEALNNAYIEIRNWFDNLDVQDEIDHKLDEMAESGELQEIITAYIQANVAWTFDNVESMVSATNLVEGSYAQTLGYYTVNDGGASVYKIVANTTPDDGSFITINGGLKAKLVVLNGIVNVKQFGAKGDGETDDTSAINKAITYVKNIVLSTDKIAYKEPVVQFSGRFKISDTLVFPPYIKYEMVGNVLMLCDLEGDKPAIHFSYGNNIPTLVNDDYTAQQWLHGQLIYGGELRLLSINNNTGTGIELGESENPNTEVKSIARTELRNISIQKFKTGILCNMYNFYIVNIENAKLHHNNCHVKFGSEVYNNVNSGENITFVNCLFGTSTTSAIINNVSSINVNFDRCSFDYCGDGILSINRNIKVAFNNCHIEGISKDSVKGIVDIPSSSTAGGVTIKFNNTYIYQHTRLMPLVFCDNNATCAVTIKESFYNLTSEDAVGIEDLSNQYMVNGGSSAVVRCESDGVNHLYIQVSKDSDLNSEGSFEDIDVDSPVTSDSYYTVSAHSNYVGAGDTAIKEISGRKYLEIQPAENPGSQNGNFLLRRAEYIPVKPNRRYLASMGIRVADLVSTESGFPNFQFNVYLEYYDENKTQIGSQEYFAGRNTDYAINTVNKDYKGKRNVICSIPNDKRIKYVIVRYQYESKTNLSNLTKVYLTGLSFEESFEE